MARMKEPKEPKVSTLVSDLVDSLSEIEGLTFDTDIEVVPTGISPLDKILGGGIPVGKLILLVGNAGGGKSTLTCSIGRGFHRHHPKSIVSYLDAEQAMNTTRLASMGCDMDRTILISQDLTIEKIADILKKTVEYKKKAGLEDVPFLVIWDSESATMTAKHKEVADVSKIIGFKANMLSWIIPLMVELCSKYKITLIIIGQLRDKIQMNQYQPSTGDLRGLGNQKLTGGNVMKFAPFQILFIKPKADMDPSTYGFSGVVSEMKIIKNKLFTPMIKVDLALDYMKGFSDVWSKFELLKTCKAIKGTGWRYLQNYQDCKFRTKQIEELYSTDPMFKERFNELYDMFIDQVCAFPDAIKLITKKDDDDDVEDTEAPTNNGERTALDEALDNLGDD